MTRFFRAVLAVSILICGAALSSAQSPARHSTAMGFTPWPVDFNEAGLDRTYAFIRAHSNLVAHHFDGGVPWDAAARSAAFPTHLQRDWVRRKANTPADAQVFVAVTPLNFGRDGLAPAWTDRGDNQRLPRAWRNKRLNDPEVVAAYTNYVQRVIAYFEPDYLAIGIEANIVISKAPELWNDYAALHAEVYARIKRAHPRLPVFATVQYEHLRGIEAESQKYLKYQRPAVATLMRSSDLLALSTYRYGTVHPNPMGPGYFDVAKSFGKPIAIAESGAMSQSNRIYGMTLPASEADQARFVSGLLDHAARNRFAFVVNWVAIDFEPGLKRLPRSVREIAKAWVNTGLQTSDGRAKPALGIWQGYLAQSRP
ncbi:MAG: hypothetical protein AAFY77_11120 [Pseudomonadota bacterium]